MKQGNLNIRCTEDYAVLYWDKPAAAPSGAEYTVSLNGEAIGRTDRTHFTIEGLSYGSSFRVDVVSGSYCIGSATLQFGREKRRIDITAAPYFCKGDGHILNTDNLQRAINDCGADDILYVPAGDFLTGALRLHSDLEIYLAKGAVLQGTTNIHDYSPRIPSRFEGTEMRCYSSLLNAGDMNHKTGPNCRNITPAILQCGQRRFDACGGLLGALGIAERRQTEIPLAAGAEALAGGAHNVGVLEQPVKKLPAAHLVGAAQPDVGAVLAAAVPDTGLVQRCRNDSGVGAVVVEVLLDLLHALVGKDGLGTALHNIGNAVELRSLAAQPHLVQLAAGQRLRHDGVAAARAGEACDLGEAAHLDGNLLRALDLKDAGRDPARRRSTRRQHQTG